MIEFKKNQLNDVYVILDQIKLNKISSSSIRKVILKLVLEIPKSIDSFQKEAEECRKRFFGDFSTEELTEFQEELRKIGNLITANKTQEAKQKDVEISIKYPKLVEAYKNYNEGLIELQNEVESYMTVDTIDINEFIDVMSNQDVAITARELVILKPIFKDELES